MQAVVLNVINQGQLQEVAVLALTRGVWQIKQRVLSLIPSASGLNPGLTDEIFIGFCRISRLFNEVFKDLIPRGSSRILVPQTPGIKKKF